MTGEHLGADVRAAVAGDQDALARLVREHYDVVRRYVAHVVDPQNAEDLVQETFIRAIRSLPSFRGDCTLVVWLLSIARRTAMDHFRARRRQPFVVVSLDVESPDTHHVGSASPDCSAEYDLRGMIAALEPNRRSVFVLTQVLGFSYAEAAQSCGVPIGTVRSRVARAREDLVAMLDACAPEEPRAAAGPFPLRRAAPAYA
jgi:RNA polymerase sigma-70 factor (ECF subfamily)